MLFEPITKRHRWVLENSEKAALERAGAITAYHRHQAISALLNDMVRLIGTKTADPKDSTKRTWKPRYKDFTVEGEKATYYGPSILDAWGTDRQKLVSFRTQRRMIKPTWKAKLEPKVKRMANTVFCNYRSQLQPEIHTVLFAEECRVEKGHAYVPLHYEQTAKLAD